MAATLDQEVHGEKSLVVGHLPALLAEPGDPLRGRAPAASRQVALDRVRELVREKPDPLGPRRPREHVLVDEDLLRPSHAA
jgi:hypothetical protein